VDLKVDSDMDHTVEYERVVKIYESTYGESDELLLSNTLSHLVSELRLITSAEPENAPAFHLLGLCWYRIPKVSVATQQSAEEAFRCCLAIDPEHQYANLFLGYLLFDAKRHKEADERFAEIDPEFFVAQSQQWRMVKNDELRLCCRLELEMATVAFHEVDVLCERYETDPAVEFIVPGEIVLCLDDLAQRDALPRESLKSYASRVLAMLQVSDNINVAYLQEPIIRLGKIVAP
jgi:hypothetical protein